MNGSTIICLLPDEEYVKRRPDRRRPHLTLGFMGYADRELLGDYLVDFTLEKIRMATAKATGKINRRIPAKCNGRGFFYVTPDVIEKDPYYAIVDLIDGAGVQQARQIVERQSEHYGVMVDQFHGFIPHMTTNFAEQDQGPQGILDPFDSFSFSFDRLAVWSGNEEWEYELT